MADRGGYVDEDAQSDESDSRGRRTRRAVRQHVGLHALHLPQEEAETGDGKSEAHEGNAGANPRKEGALGSEVDAGVLFGGLRHAGIIRVGFLERGYLWKLKENVSWMRRESCCGISLRHLRTAPRRRCATHRRALE